MFTPNLKLYAVPLAILMLSAGIAAPKSIAESTSARTVTARFGYKASAPVAQIYADFRATAERACRAPGPRPVSLRRVDAKCTADLLQRVLRRVNRTDLAAIHADAMRG